MQLDLIHGHGRTGLAAKRKKDLGSNSTARPTLTYNQRPPAGLACLERTPYVCMRRIILSNTLGESSRGMQETCPKLWPLCSTVVSRAHQPRRGTVAATP